MSKLRYALSLLILMSSTAFAQFDLVGEGEVVLLNGQHQPFDFGFSYFRQDGNYQFIVGRNSLTVPSVPKKYSLALILQDDSQVWVPDFINSPIQQFSLSIEDHKIRLFIDAEATKARGNFILDVDGDRYQFSRGPGQINFYFTEQGLKEIRVEGMYKPRR